MANTNSQDKAGVSRNAAKCWLQQYEKSQIRVNTAAVRARPCLVQDSYQSLVWDSSLSSVFKGYIQEYHDRQENINFVWHCLQIKYLKVLYVTVEISNTYCSSCNGRDSVRPQ